MSADGGVAGPGESATVDASVLQARLQVAEAEVTRLGRIVASLMRRAEREQDGHGGSFGLFANAIALEDKVEARTRELGRALDDLRRSHEVIERAKEAAEAASRTKQLLVEELEATNVALRREQGERSRMESELMLAHKLEAVGQLAAGIAHEINTPIQFIGDSAGFLSTSTRSLFDAFATCRSMLLELSATAGQPAVAAAWHQAYEDADVEFTLDEVPRALERIAQGVSRVSVLVRAMKEFGHPGQREKVPADLNHLLQTTLTVAHNEYKYVANIDTDFGPLPPIPCVVSEINQVFLNLLVNAAHAIGDKNRVDGLRGTISIRTRLDDDTAIVEIEDTGAGIPEGIRNRVFDPFFTTKAPGRGTGQGLAIARSIVVDRHGGTLAFASAPGRGTCFTLRLPVEARQSTKEVAA